MIDIVSENVLFILLIYIGFINLLGFMLMGFDKYKAKKNLYRIPEKTLFTVAFLGGSPGVWFGLKKFRHKTLHNSFRFGIPAIVFITYPTLIYVMLYHENILKILE